MVKGKKKEISLILSTAIELYEYFKIIPLDIEKNTLLLIFFKV